MPLKGEKYNEIQHELVNKVLIERLKLAREEKATTSDGINCSKYR